MGKWYISTHHAAAAFFPADPKSNTRIKDVDR